MLPTYFDYFDQKNIRLPIFVKKLAIFELKNVNFANNLNKVSVTNCKSTYLPKIDLLKFANYLKISFL